MQTTQGHPTDDEVESGYSLMPKHDFERYKKLYDDIVKGCQYVFMTISPKPNPLYSYDDVINIWFCDYAKFIRENNIDKFLLVIELSKRAQIHFHMMIKFNTIRNKYTFVKYVNRWFHLAQVEPVYNHEPKFGYLYLLKQYDLIKGVIDKSPIYNAMEIDDYDEQTVTFMTVTTKAITKRDLIQKLITDYNVR